uniref:Uncharacterized protein n=1 Tax=Anopheles maculatus TaxID=74869 RepID=A0A182SQI3_9DIPT
MRVQRSTLPAFQPVVVLYRRCNGGTRTRSSTIPPSYCRTSESKTRSSCIDLNGNI